FFDRNQASSHYLSQIDRSVETLKVTFLIDTADQVIIDVDVSAKWPNDSNIGPKIKGKNTYSLESMKFEKGYDSSSFRAQLRESGVRPLIKNRVYKPIVRPRTPHWIPICIINER
ncbi:MAG: hypothetical protein ABEI86_05415, partial [Halobacteriaceae archaeon]